MPGEGLLFFTATTLGSMSALGLALWVGRKRPHWVPWGMGAVLVLLIVKAVLHHRPDWESALFPSPLYVYLQGYWLFPLGLALLGLGARRVERARDRRAVVVAVALLFAVGTWKARWMLVPIDDSSIATADAQHFCPQTTARTCAPASCVMLLSMYGIEATEGEMARACLTTSWGTGVFDIFRGLSVKLAGQGDLRPRILAIDADEADALQRPMIVGRGPGHAVVVARVGPDQVVVHDPLGTGPETVSRESFEGWFHGPVVALERHTGGGVSPAPSPGGARTTGTEQGRAR